MPRKMFTRYEVGAYNWWFKKKKESENCNSYIPVRSKLFSQSTNCTIKRLRFVGRFFIFSPGVYATNIPLFGPVLTINKSRLENVKPNLDLAGLDTKHRQVIRFRGKWNLKRTKKKETLETFFGAEIQIQFRSRSNLTWHVR